MTPPKPVQIIRTVKAMQRLSTLARQQGRRIGFVPTMGYLHEGHVRLVQAARRQVGPDGLVVVSIYVNPTQFAPTEDLAKYPRDFRRDNRLCREAGANAIFFPTDEVMYPGRESGLYSTYVVEETLSKTMEGVSRPTHFRGVTTVVAKLFHCVLPDLAVFGAKDWQQAAVVRRMTRDLNFPIRIVVAPTHREADGLAMSSRNVYLTPSQREQAVVLWKSLQMVRRRVIASKQAIAVESLQADVEAMVKTATEARLDYVSFFDPDTLEPLTRVSRGAHAALAVFFGKTRLIDNSRLA